MCLFVVTQQARVGAGRELDAVTRDLVDLHFIKSVDEAFVGSVGTGFNHHYRTGLGRVGRVFLGQLVKLLLGDFLVLPLSLQVIIFGHHLFVLVAEDLANALGLVVHVTDKLLADEVFRCRERSVGYTFVIVDIMDGFAAFGINLGFVALVLGVEDEGDSLRLLGLGLL